MSLYEEDDLHEVNIDQCPNCGRYYDEIDSDYLICSKCGYDALKEEVDHTSIRTPDDEEYLNGDADIMSGEFY